MHNPNTGQRPRCASSTPTPVEAGGGGRRSLFAGAVALAYLPMVAQAAPNPDAELITLCGLYHGHHAASQRPDAETAEWEAEAAAAWSTADLIELIAPVTSIGLRSKALVALTVMQTCRDIVGEPLDADMRFAVRMLQDVVRGVAL